MKKIRSETLNELINQKKNWRYFYHGERKKCVVVLVHGLFQSPSDQLGLSGELYRSGCNVIAPLLPGHWENDKYAYDRINEDDWIRTVKLAIDFAKEWGDEIHLVGHSTGGLLNLNCAVHNPFDITSVTLLAPVLNLRSKVNLIIKIGAFLKLDRSVFHLKRTTKYEKQPKPLIAGKHVINLIKKTFGTCHRQRLKIYDNYKIPTLIFSTANDNVICLKEIIKFSNSSKATQHIQFSKNSGIYHDNIQRTRLDLEPNDPVKWQNPQFNFLSQKIIGFIHSKEN